MTRSPQHNIHDTPPAFPSPHRLIFLALSALIWTMGCSANAGYSDDVLDRELRGEEALSVSAYKSTIDFKNVDYPRLHAAIFWATNEAREANGLPAVKPHDLLTEAAQAYAKRMKEGSFVAHTDPKSGTTPQTRLKAIGITNPYAAENLATSPALQLKSGEPFYVINAKTHKLSRSPDGPPIPTHTYASFGRAIVKQWLNSPGHRANLLHKEALQLGCGAQLYFQGPVPAFYGVQKFQLYEPIKTN